MIAVMNKIDCAEERDLHADGPKVYVSAKTGEGMEELLQKITEMLPPTRKRVTLLLPYTEGSLAGKCRKDGVVESETYEETGLRMIVTLGPELLDEARPYIIEI